ncbi:MAG: DUF523 and DUF1722 domain-containing protein [Magnetococcales bacterium]|nr:DUF523 and DUF1722 domain-containing protein [Magnetococcales bacterium]
MAAVTSPTPRDGSPNPGAPPPPADALPASPPPRLAVGVSRCLLGDPVRYDGDHKRQPWLDETLGAWCRLVPVCPEVEAGLGLPREPMRLEGPPDAPRLLTLHTRRDLTAPLLAWREQRLAQLANEGLRGFVLKSRSPSCGAAGVALHPDAEGASEPVGTGLFAQALRQRFPLLPLEEEERLRDPPWRENFVERLHVLDRWLALTTRDGSAAGLVGFHADHKFLIMAHGAPLMRALGRLAARGGSPPLAEYGATLMAGLAALPTLRAHVDVLRHLAGFLKNRLPPSDKAALREGIEGYRQQRLPRSVPLALLHDALRRFPHPYLARQWYLRPPAEE